MVYHQLSVEFIELPSDAIYFVLSTFLDFLKVSPENRYQMYDPVFYGDQPHARRGGVDAP